MSNTTADEPENGAGGISDDELTALLKKIQSLVGKEVADKFLSLHAKGLETVALLHGTDGQRKLDARGIEGGNIRSLRDGEVAGERNIETGVFIEAIAAWLGNNQRFHRLSDRFHDKAVSVDDKSVCLREEHPTRLSVKTGQNLFDLGAVEAQGHEAFVEETERRGGGY